MNTTITINMNTTALRRLDQQVRVDLNATTTRHPGNSATAQVGTTGSSTTHLVRQPRSATMTWASPGLGPVHTTA